MMSYTSKKASLRKLDAAHRLRYSSCPAVSVRLSWYVWPSIVRVTEYESSMVGSYLRANVRCRVSHSCDGGRKPYSSVHSARTSRSVMDDLPI